MVNLKKNNKKKNTDTRDITVSHKKVNEKAIIHLKATTIKMIKEIPNDAWAVKIKIKYTSKGFGEI